MKVNSNAILTACLIVCMVSSLTAAEIKKPEHPMGDGAGEVARTYCRYVPERIDDFAWENDRVAFRAYGPGARKGAENSGIDCWLKRVEYPVINKWYGQMQDKSYHKDWGEGYDPYHVGSSAGCGGTGIWLNGKREPLETYTEWKIVACQPERCEFVLTYEKDVDGVVYKEEKRISIEMGEQLFEVKSVFYRDGEIAKNLEICVGLTTHDGKAQCFKSELQGWAATWEKIDGFYLGTAIMADPDDVIRIEEIKADQKDASHILIILKTDDEGAIEYKAGFGWERAGKFTTSQDWVKYLNKKAKRR